jgi:hypothetical protein
LGSQTVGVVRIIPRFRTTLHPHQLATLLPGVRPDAIRLSFPFYRR